MAPRSKISLDDGHESYDDREALIGLFELHEQDLADLGNPERTPDDNNPNENSAPVLGLLHSQHDGPAESAEFNHFVESSTAVWQPPPPPRSNNNNVFFPSFDLQNQETTAGFIPETAHDTNHFPAIEHLEMHLNNEDETENKIGLNDTQDTEDSSCFDHSIQENETEEDEEDMTSIIRSDAFDEDDNVAMETEEEDHCKKLHFSSVKNDLVTPSSSTNKNNDIGPTSKATLSFGSVWRLDPHRTSLNDLKQVAENHASMVPSLVQYIYQRMNSPRLICLALQLLTEYAESAQHLHWFTDASSTSMHTAPSLLHLVTKSLGNCTDWSGQEWAAQLIRTLSVHQNMDSVLLTVDKNLLPLLAVVAQGGKRQTEPLWSATGYASSSCLSSPFIVRENSRIHAVVALLNLSSGSSACKIKMAFCGPLLHTIKSMILDQSKNSFRAKALLIIKNLSSLGSNDLAIIGFPGLLHALGQVIWESTTSAEAVSFLEHDEGVTLSSLARIASTTIMNLSISKHHKHQIFCTPGLVQSLLTVLTKTSTSTSFDAELSSTFGDLCLHACTILSNLAIGYNVKTLMLYFHGFVDTMLHTILTEKGDVQSKASSVVWSLAAEKKNQIPLVQRGDVLPALVRVASSTNSDVAAIYKCIAAMALLAESPENVVPLLQSGVLYPLLHIMEMAGSDPTEWKHPTPSWCITCLLNLAQVDTAKTSLQNAGVVSLLAPLVMIDDSYQSLKAAMTVTLCCERLEQHDNNNNGLKGSPSELSYDLLRKIETSVPRIVNLLLNTLAGRGGDGYKYGVFALSPIMACVETLMSGPEFVQEKVCTLPVVEAILKILWDFCVDGGVEGGIVGGGRDDDTTAAYATRALAAALNYLHRTAKMFILQPLLHPLIHCLPSVQRRFMLHDSYVDVEDGSNLSVLVDRIQHFILAFCATDSKLSRGTSGSNRSLA